MHVWAVGWGEVVRAAAELCLATARTVLLVGAAGHADPIAAAAMVEGLTRTACIVRTLGRRVLVLGNIPV